MSLSALPTVRANEKRAISPLLIGRASDLNLLQELLEQSRQQGQIILVSGEAGIGKTRLAAELISHAQQNEILYLQGNCYEQDQPLPYAPLIDLLRNYIAARSLDTPIQVSPELLSLLPEFSTRADPPLQFLEPDQHKKRLFHAILEFVSSPPNVPRIVIVEDLHWSDETSLDFLLYLARRISAQPLLVLLTYRSDEINPSLHHLLAEYDRQRLATEITLTALTRDQTETMIRAIFELPQPVRGDFLDRIYALTEGNPFFVEETLQSLIASGEIYFENGRWERKPIRELNIARSVQDAVQRRTDQLTERAQQLLALASVIGRRFDFELLKTMTQQNEAGLYPLIKEWIAAQLVVEESAEQFAFRHALTRETVYASLLRRERKAMHKQVAETLEQLYAAAIEPHVADFAYHYYSAEVWEKALEYAQRAGEKAEAMYAPHEAIEQFSRAVQAAEQLSAPLSGLLHARGHAYETIGDFERARADYERALDAAQRAHASRAAWQAFIDLGFLWASRDYTRAGEYFQAALTLARTLNDAPTLAHTLNRIGNWYVNLDQPEPALRYHQEALEIFRDAEDQNGIAETLDLLGLTNEIAGNLLQAYADLSESVALFRKLGNQPQLISSLAELSSLGETYLGNTMVTAPLTLGDMTALVEQARVLARHIGLRSGEAYAQTMLGLYRGYYGEYDSALQLARRSLQLTKEIEHAQWNCFAHNLLGWLYLDLFSLADAQRESERAVSLAQQIGSSIFVYCTSQALAATYIAQHDLERAEAVLNVALGANPFTNITYTKRLAIAALGELALAKADAARALEIADELIRSAVNLTPETVIPRLWLLRANALTQLKRFDEAESVLDSARVTSETRIVRPMLWRIHHALGKLYQLQDRRKEAAVAYASARRIVQELTENVSDATLREKFVDGANALLPRPRALTSRRVDKARFGGLTARERQIAEFIAAGQSNREIADQLVLSERTVAAHIANILNKLTFTSRTQIAVWAVEHGLAPGN